MVGSQAGDANGQRAAHQRLGLRQTVRVLECHGEIVQPEGDLRRFGSEMVFFNGQRPLLKLFRRLVQRLSP